MKGDSVGPPLLMPGQRSQTAQGQAGPLAPVARRLAPADLFRLRRAHLEAQDAHLRAEMARHRLQAMTLALERRYGLLGLRAAIDVHTGAITLSEAALQKDENSDDAIRHPDPSAP